MHKYCPSAHKSVALSPPPPTGERGREQRRNFGATCADRADRPNDRFSVSEQEPGMKANKPTICVDFDGVLHSYVSGWQGIGVCNDPPIEGAEHWLHEVTRFFRVAIYSSRSKSLRGRWAMKRYMARHFNMPLTFSPDHRADFLHEEVYYPWFKPPALLTIDDRAMRFAGVFPSVDAIKRFRPYKHDVKLRAVVGGDIP